jgi:F-type H+-transporting ATPase subunit delta
MLPKAIAKKYAGALYEVAKSLDRIEETKTSLLGITSSMDKQACVAFNTPKVALKTKETEIRKVFSGRLSKELINFLCLLVEKKRFMLLPEIGTEFQNIYNAMHGFMTAGIKSAFLLSEEQKARITAALETKYKSAFLLEYSVDPSLLGGMIITLNTQMFDGSLKNKLAEIEILLRR